MTFPTLTELDSLELGELTVSEEHDVRYMESTIEFTSVSHNQHSPSCVGQVIDHPEGYKVIITDQLVLATEVIWVWRKLINGKQTGGEHIGNPWKNQSNG